MPDGEVAASFTSPVLRPVVMRQFGSHLRAAPKTVVPPPILGLTGPGGIGKTTILRQLSAELDQKTPRAYVDCAATGIDGLADLLKVVKFCMSRRCPSVGRLWFVRLEIALIAVSGQFSFANDRKGQRDLEQTVSDEMTAVPGPLGNIVGALSGDLLGYLTGVPLESTGAEIGQAVAGAVSRQRSESKLFKRALEWFGHRDRDESKNPIDVLAEANQLGGQQADEMLVDAFFADLRDAYRPERLKIAWWNNAVLLLDNADGKLGQYFLALVRKHRDFQTRHPRGSEPLLITTAGRTAKNSGIDTEYLNPRDFTEDEVVELARPVPDRVDKRFGKLVYHLTGGYPSASAALVNAQCQHLAEVGNGLESLLVVPIDGPGDDGGATVEQRMFASLEKLYLRRRDEDELSEELLEALTTCVASRTLPGATDLLKVFHDGKPVTDQRIATTQFWNEDRSSSGLSLLRWFLLRRLARREPGPDDWNSVFSHLRRNSDDPVDRLYYAMATEAVEFVADELTAKLGDTGTERTWLELVREIGTAPCKADLSNPYQRLTALARTLTVKRGVAAQPHRYEVGRVAVGMWITSQRCVGPARLSVHGELSTDLSTLVPYADDGEELMAESERQEELRDSWKAESAARQGGRDA